MKVSYAIIMAILLAMLDHKMVSMMGTLASFVFPSYGVYSSRRILSSFAGSTATYWELPRTKYREV